MASPLRPALLAALMLAASPVLPPSITAIPVAHAADPDPIDFLFRMGMLEGHLMIGKELLDAGQVKLALPHFGHPVAELYSDVSPWMEANRLPSFEADLVRLEAAVASAPKAAATGALYRQVLDSVHAARASAPAALRDSVPEMIRICSDTIDAAAGEYGEAVNRGRIDSPVEYHDSRGYLGYVSQELGRLSRAAPAADKGLMDRFGAVLSRARWIVEPLMPPEKPRATVTQYRAVAADAAKIATAAKP